MKKKHLNSQLSKSARQGNYTCHCGAYKFPHRFSGGRCGLQWWVERYWNDHWGAGDCANCNSFVEGQCQVASGQENVTECEALSAFINYEEVKIGKKAWGL